MAPAVKFSYGECNVGDHIDALCSITNNSALLPTAFTTKPLAHFHPNPCNALIKPLQSADVMISFKPRQMGTFASKLQLNFLGAVLDPATTPSGKTRVEYEQVVIHTLWLQLHGTCNNPRASPRANHVGLSSSVSSSRTNGVTRRRNDSSEVAHPNDRATSIRPAERHSKIR